MYCYVYQIHPFSDTMHFECSYTREADARAYAATRSAKFPTCRYVILHSLLPLSVQRKLDYKVAAQFYRLSTYKAGMPNDAYPL